MASSSCPAAGEAGNFGPEVRNLGTGGGEFGGRFQCWDGGAAAGEWNVEAASRDSVLA